MYKFIVFANDFYKKVFKCILGNWLVLPEIDFCYRSVRWPYKRFYRASSILFSTSNHNSHALHPQFGQLYLIEILHQTTTVFPCRILVASLYLIEILHQTTTSTNVVCHPPQLYLIEILHQTTTYNIVEAKPLMLYLIEILHQTTTTMECKGNRCLLYLIEILHQTTTFRTF